MKKIKLFIIVVLALLFAVIASTQGFAADSRLEVHFIDVGQGDCALLVCDGKAAMIDGGGSDKSQLVYTYLRDHDIDELEYMFGTHPDDDHIGGLSAALNEAKVKKAYCTTTVHDSKSFNSLKKYLDKQNVKLVVPKTDDEFKLGNAKIRVLGVGKNGETNNDSIILKVEHGKNSFLFMGDAEKEAESVLLTKKAHDIPCKVLKVSHHGSDDSSSEDFIKAVSPEYAVISVGENTYGHPAKEVLDRLKSADCEVHRTDTSGDIVFVSDGKSLQVNEGKKFIAKAVSKNSKKEQKSTDKFTGNAAESSSNESAETDADVTYILNSNTGRFHYPNCKSVKRMNDSNKVFFTGTREEAIAKGYEPCGNCHP